MESISCEIRKVIYRHHDGWGVLALGNGSTATGELPPEVTDHSGSRSVWRLLGEWTTHPRYGRQFKFVSCAREIPASGVALAEYLAETCPDVGPTRARAVIDLYGEDAMRVLKEDPQRVARDVKGITPERAERLREALIGSERDEVLTLTLLEWLGPDGTPSLIQRIKKRWGDDAPRLVRHNPYILCDLAYCGFSMADRIATAHGIKPDDANRLYAGVEHEIESAARDGHTSYPAEDLVRAVAELLDLDEARVLDEVNFLGERGEIMIEDGHAYLKRLYWAERRLADRLVELEQAEPRRASQHDLCVEGLYPDQLAGRDLVLSHRIAILTGAPGTGKTYLVKSILEAFPDAKIALCAPTGKAARRLSELTDRRALTIHKLLAPVMTPEGRFAFTRGTDGACPACGGTGVYDPGYSDPSPCVYCDGTGEKQPIDADVIVVDETSMLDLELAYHLISAITPGTRVIFVGDPYQLPSVGPGNVLGDLSRHLPHVSLTEIKRQALGSRIVIACHAVKDGRSPSLEREKDADLVFVNRSGSPEAVLETVREIVVDRLPARGHDPFSDIQVITALRKNTVLGCKHLNEILQKAYGRVPTAGRFAIGDKVIQLRNTQLPSVESPGSDYVVNGDIGIVEDVDEKKKRVAVRFENPDRLVWSPWSEVDGNLELAYAVTVHKYQGSEAPVVVLPIHRCLGIMVPQRNWIYTALSRASKLCVVVGQLGEIASIVRRQRALKRHARLGDRLGELFNGKN
jgi:exodeoxyribonuclease V alpha subunit